MAWGGIAALLRTRFNAHEILVTLMLSYIAIQLLGWLVRGPMQDPDGFNFPQSRAAFQTYIDSAQRFSELAGAAGADVLLSNHTALDGSTTKMPDLKKRSSGAPHPYVVGKDSVSRYLRVAQNCASVMLLKQTQ